MINVKHKDCELKNLGLPTITSEDLHSEGCGLTGQHGGRVLSNQARRSIEADMQRLKMDLSQQMF